MPSVPASTPAAPTPPAPVTSASVKRTPPPLRRRLMIAIAVVVITIAPAVIMLVVTWAGTGQMQSAATSASVPAIAGMFAAASGGRRFAVLAALVMALVAPLAVVAGVTPVAGAALMALLCMTVGRMARFGLQRSALLVPVMMAWPLIDPPAWAGQTTVDRTDSTYLLWMTLIYLVGGLFPALVVPWILRKRTPPVLKEYARGDAVVYTVIITTLATAATYYMLDSPKRFGGAFIIAAILVLAPIGQFDTLRPTLLRVGGTLLGSVLLIAMVSQISSLAVIYLLGVLLIVIAIIARFGRQGWVYYVFMVPAAAALNATSLSQVSELGKQRVLDNIAGGALVLIATALAIGYSHWASRRGQASDADDEASMLAYTPA